MKVTKNAANLLCLIVAVIWGGGFIATDLALESFSPFALLCVRFVGAAILGWIPVLVTKDRITMSDLKTGILSGVFLYGGFAFQTFGLQMTEPGMNAFLTAVNVILVPYIAWIVLKQKPHRMIVAASILCLIGIGFLSLSSGSFQFRFGDVLSLICALMFACQIVSLDRAKDSSVWVVNALQLSVAAVLSVPFGLTAVWPESLSLDAIWYMGYLIVFSTFLCYMLQTIAQQHTSPAAASILLCTESLWANVFNVLILHSAIGLPMILGGICIFGSILIVEGRALFASKKSVSSELETAEQRV